MANPLQSATTTHGGGTTDGVSLSSLPTAGNVVVAIFQAPNQTSATVTSVTDGNGSVYSKLLSTNFNTSFGAIEVWATLGGVIPGTGTYTATMNLSTTSGGDQMSILELPAGYVVDQSGVNNAGSSATTATVTSSAVDVGTTDFVLALFSLPAGSSPSLLTPAGYTSIALNNFSGLPGGVSCCYRNNASALTDSAVFNWTGAQTDWAGLILSFRLAPTVVQGAKQPLPGPGPSPNAQTQFAARRLSNAITVVSRSLTGQPAAFSTGTVTPSTSVAATGQAATFTPGTVTEGVTVALTGSAATFSTGVVLEGVSPSLTGAAIASSTGNVTPGNAVAVLGQAATFTTGSVSEAVALALTGQAANFSTGTLIQSGADTGVGRSLAMGPGISPDYTKLFTPIRLSNFIAPGSNVTVGLSGQAMAAATGTITPSMSTGLTGQAATFTTGTVAPTNSLAVTGQSATFATGAVTPSRSLAVTGQSATFATGTISPALAAAVNGQAAAFTTGNLIESAAYGLTGQGANFAMGAIAESVTIGLTGQPAVFSTGNVGVNIGGNVTVALSGSAADFGQGALTLAANVAIAGQAATFGTGTVVAGNGENWLLTGSGATFAPGQVQRVVSIALAGSAVTCRIGSLSPPPRVGLLRMILGEYESLLMRLR